MWKGRLMMRMVFFMARKGPLKGKIGGAFGFPSDEPIGLQLFASGGMIC